MTTFKKWISNIKYIGTILLIIATFLDIIIGAFGYLWGVVESSIRGELNQYHQDIATAEDAFGNVIVQYFFNVIMIKKGGYKFGLRKETCSSVYGKNKALKTLTKLGAWVAKDLDEIQPDHVEMAIDNSVQ